MAIIRRVTRIANPRKRRTKVKRRASTKARRTRSNPVLLEFGALNPHKKRRKSVAKRRRHHRRNPSPVRARVSNRRHKRRNHRRRNPSVRMHNRRRHYHRRRNPVGINKQLVEMAGGVLTGAAASKYLPTLIPTSVLGAIPSSSFTVPLVTGVGTAMAGWLAHKFLPMGVAAGVVAGGAALTLSRLLDVI